MDQDMWPEKMPDPRVDSDQSSRTLHDAAVRFFDDIERAGPVGSAPHLRRVEAGGSSYVLREWAAGTTLEHVNLTQRALQMAAPASGNRLPVPQAVRGDPETWAAALDGRFVSAASWLPGRPLARYGDFRTPDGDVIDVPLPASAPAEPIILEAVKTIGRFHTVTAPIASDSGGGQVT